MDDFDKCRRCAECGADHYFDRYGNLVYFCEHCKYNHDDRKEKNNGSQDWQRED